MTCATWGCGAAPISTPSSTPWPGWRTRPPAGGSRGTPRTFDLLKRYGAEDWFPLGDRDLATHLRRTTMLAGGATLTAVTASLTRALDVRATILPMCDEPVGTIVETPSGPRSFPDYFVRRHHQDPVSGNRLGGIAAATLPEGVGAALDAAAAIIFCPSNPFVSRGPILAVPGFSARRAAAPAPRVAVSPISGGRALKGPADQLLAGLGHHVLDPRCGATLRGPPRWPGDRR